jgi:hypothetical protein
LLFLYLGTNISYSQNNFENDGTITLEWSGSDADEDPLSYIIEMDTTDGLQGTIVVESTTDSQATVNVDTDTIYYWRIITSDGVNSSTSIVYSFRTLN